MAWQAGSLRLTVFGGDSASAVSARTWQSVAGTEPEAEETNRKIGVSRYWGPVTKDGSATLEIRSRATRQDWLFTPSLSSGKQLAQLPTLGTLDEVTKQFRDMLAPWLAEVSGATRLAFGAVCTQPVKDVPSGYALLRPLLPSVSIPEGSTDFYFQINRPREAASVRGMPINRLSKWSVVAVSGIEIEMGAAGGAEVQPSGTPLYASHVELDINTMPGVSIPAGRALVALADELIGLALEIANKGDVP